MGINLSSHDRSVCLLEDEKIACAISEERLDRRKRSEIYFKQSAPRTVFEIQTLLPMRAISYCLETTQIGIDDVSLFVIGRSIISAKESTLQSLPIKDKSKIVEIPFPNHHLAHAYSTYFCSPYKESAILVIDEQGSWLNKTEYEKCSLYYAKGTNVSLLKTYKGTINDGSLGVFFDYFCALLGLSEAGRFPAAGKLMALAAYGNKNNLLSPILKYRQDGNVGFSYLDIKKLCDRVGIEYIFNKRKIDRHYETGLSYFSFKNLSSNSRLGKDFAYLAQTELEKGVLHIANHLTKIQPSKNLSYAGGVALNCIANSLIIKSSLFKNLFIQPAATDDGTAIGLAYYGLYKLYKSQKRSVLYTAYLGKEYTHDDYKNAIQSEPFNLKLLPNKNLLRNTAKLLARGKIIGWFQGRSEFGPRALGNRSILAHPGIKGIKKKLNEKIKKRETFRPFAPVIIENRTRDFFNLPIKSPFMLLNTSVKPLMKNKIPEVIHVDGSSRIQTVNLEENPLLYKLLQMFNQITNLPLLLNTSFNTEDEPIVEKPRDALRTFFKTNIDCLVLGPYLIEKDNLPKKQLKKIREIFASETVNFEKKGQSAMNKGFYQEAIDNFIKALKISCFKNESEIYANIAKCYFSLSKYKLAAKNAVKSIEINYQSTISYLIAFRSYNKLNRSRLSLNILKSGVKNNPKEGILYLELAEFYIKNKKNKEVIKLIKKLIQLEYRLPYVCKMLKNISNN